MDRGDDGARDRHRHRGDHGGGAREAAVWASRLCAVDRARRAAGGGGCGLGDCTRRAGAVRARVGANFSSRGGSQWFEVGRNTYKPRASRPQKEIPVLDPLEQLESLGAQAHAHLGEVLERERGYRDGANQARISSKTLDPATFATTSVWLDRTQWQSTYRDVRRDVLLASTRLPDRRSLIEDQRSFHTSSDQLQDLTTTTRDSYLHSQV